MEILDNYYTIDSEEKLGQTKKIGFIGLGLLFFSLILLSSNFYEPLLYFFSTLFSFAFVVDWELCYTWDAIAPNGEIGTCLLPWNAITMGSVIPIFNCLLLLHVFSQQSISKINKIFATIFCLSFVIDLLALIETYYFDVLSLGLEGEFSKSYTIALLLELFARIIIFGLTVCILVAKINDITKYLSTGLLAISIVLFFNNFYAILTFANLNDQSQSFFDTYSGSYSLYVFLQAISFPLVAFSLERICSYRFDEPWIEEEIVSYSQSETSSSSGGMTTEAISKLKSLSELYDSGVLSKSEFEEQKAKVMSETSTAPYVVNGEPIDDTFRILMYIVSFLIPIVGIIIGIIYTMRPDDNGKEFGKMCLKIAIGTIVVGFLLGIIFTLVLFSSV